MSLKNAKKGIASGQKKPRVNRVDLKSALPPGLRPATKLELLRARQAKIQELQHRPAKKTSKALMTALASQAKIGVSSPDYRVSDLMRLAKSNSPYKGIAGALVRIWKWQRADRLDVLVEDRRILNSLTNRLRATANPNFKGKLIFTKAEKKVLRSYLLRMPKEIKPDFELGN